MKNIIKLVITALFISLINQNISFAEDELLLKSDFKNAYIKYNAALEEAKTPVNYLNMCKLTFLLQDDSTAKEYCKTALKEIEKQKNPDYELKSEILSMMGNIYSTAYHNNNISLEYYNQAKEYKNKNTETDKYDLAKLYRNLAYTYNYSGNSNMAEIYWDKALKIIDEQNSDEYKTLKAVVYNDLSLFEKSKQHYDKAKEYLDKALKSALDANEYINHRIVSIIYENIALYYEFNKKNKAEAVKNFRLFLAETSKFPDKELLTNNSEMPKDTTIEDIDKMLKEYPYDVDLNVMTGAYNISLDEKESKPYFDKAILVNPDNAYVYLAIANAYADKYTEIKFKEYSQMAKEYAKMAELRANYTPDVYLTLGLINTKIDAIFTANTYFGMYVKNSEDKAMANCEIASVFWYNDPQLKYRKYVVYYLEKAKKLKELNAMYKMMLMAAYKQIGNTAKADDMATQLIKKNVEFEE